MATIDTIFNDLKIIVGEMSSANDGPGATTLLSKDEFENAVLAYVGPGGFNLDLRRGPTFKEQVTNPTFWNPFQDVETDTNEKNFVQELIKVWPEDLRTEGAITSVNFGLLAREFAKANPKFTNVAEKVAVSYEQFQRKNVIEPYLQAQNQAAGKSNADLEIQANRWIEATKNIPLNLSQPFGLQLQGAPLPPAVAGILAKAEMNLGAPISTPQTPMQTPESGSSMSDASTPPTNDQADSGYQTVAEQSGDSSSTFAGDIQEFFDRYPDYQFTQALQMAQQYEYAGFNEFALRYGTVQTSTKGSWSVLNAHNWIDGLDATQLGKVQDDLRQAGYFDAVGTLPRARGLLDETTRTAWAFFLADAAKNNTTPLDWYIKSKTAMRQNVWDQQVQKTDPATIKAQVGDLSQSMLGRRLNDDELASLTERIRDWEREFVYGQSTSARENEQVDIGARIEQYIQTNMSNEFAVANAYESRRAFERVFGNG